ncbi:MAG: SDR family oxidoreductase [Patescibacteria group bacterium]
MKINDKKNLLNIDLSDKIAIVTGGDRGIGREIVAVLAKCGAIIFMACRHPENDRSENYGDEAGEFIDRGLEVHPISVDVTSQESVDKMVREIISKYGRIDILVNNAGVLGASGWENRQEENDEDWEMNYQVNLRGLARATQAVVPYMKQAKYGKIINIASNAGRGGNKDHIPSAYGATKAAVINLTQTNALDLAPYNINVNCVCPGIIWTPMLEIIGARLSALSGETKGLTPEEVFAWQAKTRVPLGRGQTGEDVGNMTAFLVSELAKNITGQSINVNGGIRMN